MCIWCSQNVSKDWLYLKTLWPPCVRKPAQMDRALNSRSKARGFHLHYWSCVKVSGKLSSWYCLDPVTHNGYLLHNILSKVAKILVGNVMKERYLYFSFILGSVWVGSQHTGCSTDMSLGPIKWPSYVLARNRFVHFFFKIVKTLSS